MKKRRRIQVLRFNNITSIKDERLQKYFNTTNKQSIRKTLYYTADFLEHKSGGDYTKLKKQIRRLKLDKKNFKRNIKKIMGNFEGEFLGTPDNNGSIFSDVTPFYNTSGKWRKRHKSESINQQMGNDTQRNNQFNIDKATLEILDLLYNDHGFVDDEMDGVRQYILDKIAVLDQYTLSNLQDEIFEEVQLQGVMSNGLSIYKVKLTDNAKRLWKLWKQGKLPKKYNRKYRKFRDILD